MVGQMKVSVPKTQNADFDLQEDLEMLESLSREDFMKVYKLINSLMFEMPSITMDEIHKIEKGEESYFDSPEVRKLVNNHNEVISDEDSEAFIRKVKASNVTDIADSGFFYKKICNLLDDFYITDYDCGADGIEVDTANIDKDYFDYKVKDCFIEETGKYYNRYKDFKNEVHIPKIHVRTPSNCKNASKRCVCSKCVGSLNTGGRELTSKNIGFITALAITESATQASLSSMNKGQRTNVNKVLEMKLPKFDNWEDVVEEINKVVNSIGLGEGKVQARWFEITLIGRYVKINDKYVGTTLQNNNNYSEDALSAYIFRHSEKNLNKLLNAGEFELKSIKSKAFFGLYT